MHNIKYIYSLIFLMGMAGMTFAHVGPNQGRAASTTSNTASLRADCAQGTSKVIQSINNVRAMLLNSGDVWWDLDDGQYVVPKVEPGMREVSSIFAGAVWIGGFSPGGSLKMAAQDYRNGNSTDFWPGPLSDVGAVGEDTCANWDRHFRVLGDNINLHIQRWELAKAEGRTELDRSEIPADVLGWPAVGNEFFFDIYGFDLPENNSQGLAYFFDNIADGIDNQIGVYEPHKGDFPRIEIRDCEVETLKDVQYADEMYFWIYNDAGGAHTQSGGEAIRMEVQVQSFAWKTNDEINDMTFQRYKLINRAVEDIDSTFFSMWVDPDLGCYTDDYIGCDTTRSLAYVYNQDGLDGTTGCQCNGGVPTYCDEIPVLGVDYFRGPLNEFGEEIGMSSFTYSNSGAFGNPPGTQDPSQPDEFYNFISGTWRDGTPFTFGGSGYNPGIGGDIVKYAFPDPPNEQAGWSMFQSNLPSGDRRTLQASGPFKLKPGAINELIVGVVWVPDISHPSPDMTKLFAADDIAQALFDNCFDITDGPDAPDVDFIELDRELVMILSNGDSLSTNNSRESYSEIDLQAPPVLSEEEASYKFEGYRIYQLAGPNISIAELDDVDKARLVRSVDVKNGISQLYNWSSIPDPGSTEVIWIPSLQNEGVLDNGITHTFGFTEDAFAAGDNKLVNHKKYYFTVVAYAHNNWQQFDPVNRIGQKKPYLEGRRNIGDGERPYYTVTPHPTVYKNLNSSYGDGPVITRLDGVGVGANNISLSAETEAASLDGSLTGELIYKPGRGPINVKIYNPLDVKDGEFELTFVNENTGTNDGNDELDSERHWKLTNLSDPSSPILSDLTIERLNEQVLKEYGFSLTVGQTDDAGDEVDATNGFISYNEINEGDAWFSSQVDAGFPFNYIKTDEGEIDFLLDPAGGLSSVGNFVPYVLTDYQTPDPNVPSTFNFTPALRNVGASNVVRQKSGLKELNNVDIVFTSDKSKWSRCVVVETAIPEYYDPAVLGLLTEGEARNLELRAGASVGKDGGPDGDGTGMGWFPGYAIDQETGERLNIFFGENSIYHPEQILAENFTANGRDMIWNPTDEVAFVAGQNAAFFPVLLGGQHYIYVTREKYDQCALLRERLDGSLGAKIKAFEQITWTSMSLLVPGTELLPISEGLIPSELRVELRVDNPYQVEVGTNQFAGYPAYQFKLEGNEATPVEPGASNVDVALDMINVVPNPYYGYSAYEISQFTNTVKITNLPPKCDVNIYSLDGKFIRRYVRDEVGIPVSRPNAGVAQTQISPALEWDLKNSKGIPVASGVYLIHINAEGLGERVIKWFGVARKFDPSGL